MNAERRCIRGLLVVAIGCAVAATSLDAQVVPDPAKECAQCAAWNVPQQPFRIFGNTYYVGTAELSAILVAGDDGLVLLDGALPQSAALIAANIEALGFELADVRLIVNSHTHFDHAGGIAALQRASGAAVAGQRAGRRSATRRQAEPRRSAVRGGQQRLSARAKRPRDSRR